jgi:hypothetical protein
MGRRIGEVIAMSMPTPVLQIRTSDSGRDFSVAAKWDDGRLEEISEFKSESEANDWIARKFQDWIAGQDQARKGS